VIVVDASALLDFFGGFANAEWVAESIVEDDVHAPHLVDLEFANGLRGAVARRVVSARSARAAIDDFQAAAVVRYPHSPLLDRIWELRHALSAYDAAYVALAELLDVTLVTTDERLARSHGHRARIVSP
jgi:predicted nucleic acid-binding protein